MPKSLKSVLSTSPTSLTNATIHLVATLLLSQAPILKMIEPKTDDLRFRSRGHLPPTPPLASADNRKDPRHGRTGLCL